MSRLLRRVSVCVLVALPAAGCDDPRVPDLERRLSDQRVKAEVAERMHADLSRKVESLSTALEERTEALNEATRRATKASAELVRLEAYAESVLEELESARAKLAQYESVPGWRTKAAWNRMQQQMTKQEVADLLGSPPGADAQDWLEGNGLEAWHYPNDDTISGKVWFTREGKVAKWKLPFGMEQ